MNILAPPQLGPGGATRSAAPIWTRSSGRCPAGIAATTGIELDADFDTAAASTSSDGTSRHVDRYVVDPT